MWPESGDVKAGEQKPALRSGLTTGSCATACSVAAANLLFQQRTLDVVSITLPRGKIVEMPIISCLREGQGATASTLKDAGDDPDVTHGARVFVRLQLTNNSGVEFCAGPGVGTVTREGLVLAVGEAAINPVPRKMISEHLLQLASEQKYSGGFKVEVGVEGGENLALKTMNPRLGIIGGLSILGTTGIVRPFSCAAYIASINQGIDVARANDIKHIAATTGSTSEAAIRQHYNLSDMALIEMGDFVGAVFKHLKRAPIERLSLCGGFGKLCKLADGHLDLHSRASHINFKFLAETAADLGAAPELLAKIEAANTSIEALKLCSQYQLDLASAICTKALIKARSIVPSGVSVEVWAVDRQGMFVGCAGVDGDSGSEL